MKKFILYFLLISMITITSVYGIVAIAVEDTTLVGTATPIETSVIKAYAFETTPFTDFDLFPIDAREFNKSVDHFCIQHNVSYGGQHYGNYLGKHGACTNTSGGDCNSGHGAADYHKQYKVTINKANRTKVTDYTNGDLDTSADYYIGTDFVVHKKYTTNPLPYIGYRDQDDPTPTDWAITNWIYEKNSIQMSCETGKAKISFLLACFKAGSGNSNYSRNINAGTDAMHSYSWDPLQAAVWGVWKGQDDNTVLKKQAEAYEKYHTDSANPKVNVFPDAHVGTTISADGNTYSIGPFKMSEYISADMKDASGNYAYQCNQITGVTAKYSVTEKTASLQDVFYASGVKNSSGVAKPAIDLKGGIIKTEVILTDGTSDSAPIDINYTPGSGETFYINLTAAQVGSYDELKTISFTYQRIHACANGNEYIGYQYRLDFEQDNEQNDGTYGRDGSSSGSDRGCSSGYACVTCKHTGLSWTERHEYDASNDGSGDTTHAYWCLEKTHCEKGTTGSHAHCGHGGTSGTCHTCTGYQGSLNCSSKHHSASCHLSHNASCPKNPETGAYTDSLCTTQHSHTGWSSASSPGCYNTSYCSDVSLNYCSHGHVDGKHDNTESCSTGKDWGASHTDACHANTECTHGHSSCNQFTWLLKADSHDVCQDGFAGAGTLVNEKRLYKIRVDVPLKTKMKIYKYITKVEHRVNDSDAKTPAAVDDRSDWDYGDKRDDPVKVERGDIVYYKIKITNESRFPTAVKVMDTLPDEFQNLVGDANFNKFKYQLGGVWSTAAWIEVAANGEVVIDMHLDPDAMTGTHENHVEFITRNQIADPVIDHMKYVKWGENATNGEHTYGNIVNADTSREEDGDFYTIKEYDVSLDKYVVKVEHSEGGKVTYDDDSSRKNIDDEEEKENDPVPIESGDIVTYHIDVYNTKDPYLSNSAEDREEEPFWDPDLVYVDIEDEIPRAGTVQSIKADNGQSWGNFPIEDLKIKAGEMVTVEVKILIDQYFATGSQSDADKYTNVEDEHYFTTGADYAAGRIEKNTARIKTDTIENVNKKVIKNNPSKPESSDWVIIKEYAISIDKYITKVRHSDTGGGEETYNSTERKNIDEEDNKKNNPVKISNGDVVTYTIDVYNTNAQYIDGDRDSDPYWAPDMVYVDVKDTLPPSHKVISVTTSNGTGTCGTTSPIEVTDLEVPEDGVATITIEAEIYQRDSTDAETQPITVDDQYFAGGSEHSRGRVEENKSELINRVRNINKRDIVNHSEKPESSDWVRFKEFDVSLDKYITEVKHDTTGEVTFSGTDRKNKDSEATEKQANPVYAEYGDVVTYTIDIYNTKDPYITGGDRDGDPYYDPDLIYVDVEDKLPNKYNKEQFTDACITVSNGTGTVTIDNDNNKFTIEDIKVDKNEITTITVTIIVEEHVKETLEENNIKIINRIRNINRLEVINHPSKKSTSDWYKINDYNLRVDKYISDYKHEMTDINNTAKFTDEKNTLVNRYELSEARKKEAPVQAEKTETIIYSIRLTNDSTESGLKKATKVRPTKIQDQMDNGLKFEKVIAKMYKTYTDEETNEVKYSSEDGDFTVTPTDIGNNTYTFEIPTKASDDEYLILEPGECIIYYVTVKVTKTNMYLYNLENTASLRILTNINHDETHETKKYLSREVKNDDYNENIAPKQTSMEFVKLKDLVIAGRVWLDKDKDGLIGKNGNGVLEAKLDIESDPPPSTNLEDKEYAMKGIVVNLYALDSSKTTDATDSTATDSTSDSTSTATKTAELVRTTKTDENGMFTFGRDENMAYRTPNEFKAAADSVGESDQRVPKANRKDDNKNYTTESELIDYYVEYVYDGLIYKCTEIYANHENVESDIVNKLGELINNDKHKIDSNAYEFDDDRDNFNKKFEIVAFNKSYTGDQATTNDLDYEKIDHVSYIRLNKAREMTARSFIKKNSNNSISNTELLWLYELTTEDEKPETEYLKYINLGLEEREDVDIDITQDVYELKTTINGEEMVYEYNQNNYTLRKDEVTPDNVSDESADRVKAIDKAQEKGEGGTESAESLAYNSEKYMTGYQSDTAELSSNKKLYNFEYYLEDYHYRISQYHIGTIRAYKGSPYRASNSAVNESGTSVILDNTGGDGISNKVTGRESELNTEITFRIKVTNNAIEVDEPFYTKQEGVEQDIKVYTGINEIVEYYDEDLVDLEYDSDGTIRGFNVKTKKLADGTDDPNGYLHDKEVKVVSAKAVMSDGSEKAVSIKKESQYNAGSRTTKVRNLTGYDTLYITPADQTKYQNSLTGNNIKAGEFILEEGESMDILITLVVEKAAETPDKVEMETILGAKEVIAEVSAYSTYYKNDDGSYKSASLIDRNSNPGNFGEAYGGVSDADSAGYVKYYEDDTFRTGINLKTPTPPPPPPGGDPEEETIYKENAQRTLNGMVWDDARSDEATDENGTQYIGNGIFNGGDAPANDKVRTNPAVEKISKSEANDFKVKGVKAELVEVVKMPGAATGETYYYEDTIYANGDDSIMKMRTLDDGTYQFEGYVPGNYIVRFTYGDYDDNEAMNVNELPPERIIFNGQDYKSTTYQAGATQYAENAVASGDNTKEDVALEILENKTSDLVGKRVSDAKDDEISRLDTISYSETMDGRKNDELRGVFTTNSRTWTNLLSQTNVHADTSDFLVRPEKEKKKVTILTYQEYNKKITEITTSSRFKIRNIDFGLQYRPELQVALNKFISNITVTTSDTVDNGVKEPLIDAHFNEYYGVVLNTDFETGAVTFATDSTGKNNILIPKENINNNTEIENIIKGCYPDDEAKANDIISKLDKTNDGIYVTAIAGTVLDEETSVGLNNVTYLQNEYEKDPTTGLQALKEEPAGSGRYVVEANQGFAYLILDDNIMQGATIKIDYLFAGTNISEIDRVAGNLSNIRFKGNQAANCYGGRDYYMAETYQLAKSNGESAISLINQTYSPAKTASNALFSEYYRYELDDSGTKAQTTLGQDVIYRVKPKSLVVDSNKVIDIKDVTDPHTGSNEYYGRYLGSTYYTGKISPKEVIAELKLDTLLDYIDNDLVFNDTNNKGANGLWKTTTSGELVNTLTVIEEGEKLKDADGREYDTDARSNLAVSLDDRKCDDIPEEDNPAINKDFSKFLMPRYAKDDESYGKISLVTSKVLSPEDNTDDMIYENIAEIIQYTSVTGRITNLATSVGNARVEEISATYKKGNESPEFHEGRTESDTASVEKITLTPPTGLNRIDRTVRDVVEGASYTVIVIIGIMLVCVTVAGIVTIYHKRRIK